ncbi:hypothetical protein ABB30_12695 [Stenotrophomonas ginsengisoli]|uniref:Uncharacterized protein n=1 Tax=Stenotrophomonas ginsengisoli TaxID=336566 RepID=A0A0R0D1F3_9GAMM|nr:hypothetical protein [Stenotrophomonas ginsengisoli]KRG75046.1 hypothetical protein ABB30_12695 [Stenotrophomonas ginsengisoli]
MEYLARLQQSYSMHKIGVSDLSDGIDWAMDRLRLDQEGDDLDIVLLAGAATTEEALPYVEAIVARYSVQSEIDYHLVAGKYLVELHQRYLAGFECANTLKEKFDKIYQALGYPDWMVMLSRNCEYATDISAFLHPFEQEFKYIAGLWYRASSISDFESVYSREVSNRIGFN